MDGDTDRASTEPSGPAGNGGVPVMEALRSAAREGWEAENRAAAQRFVACYALLLECWREYGHGIDGSDDARPGHAVVDGLVAASGYVVAAMSVSSRRAEKMLSFSWDLHTRYPAILEAMAAGLMEKRIAEMLARLMATVHSDVIHQVQRQVVEDYLNGVAAGIRLGDKALRDEVDAVIGRYDRNGIRLRREDASRARGVRIGRGIDGMSTVSALLATEEAAVLAEALDRRVAEHEAADADAAAAQKAARTAGPDSDSAERNESDETAEAEARYSKAERRADALMSLICGDTPGRSGACVDGDGTGRPEGPGAADTAADGPQGPVLRPKVTVIATGDNGRGEQGARVEFARTGDAALQTLLDMLATSDGATLEQVDPRPGAADDDLAALRYRPSAGLARRIRLRDGTCRHPGCTVPADDCDLDHVVPFNHADPARGGRTEEGNLVCHCRRHHRFKTFSDWCYEMQPDGTLIVVTPDGVTMVTRPEGPLAQYRREQQRAEAEAWDRQQRRNPAPATGAGVLDEATYFARRAQRLARERAHAAEGAEAAPDPREQASPAESSRWWQRNKPTESALEQAIYRALQDHLDELTQPPPPF